MKIYPIDSSRTLWSVENLLDSDEVDQILNLDWPSMPWSRGLCQEKWPRRAIDTNCEAVVTVSKLISNKLPLINLALNKTYQTFDGIWWLDEPGFTVGLHTDGELPAVMQMYWLVPGDQWGTCFYHYKHKSHLRHQFLSKVNTGYIMLNYPDESGYRELLWHGMTNPVPAGSWRLSSYWYLN
jgi:hypothetical protein